MVSFDLAPGASSKPILLAPDTPVFIIATSTTGGDYGAGSLSVVDNAGQDIAWTGEDASSPNSAGPALTGGSSLVAGTVMLTFDTLSLLSLQVYDADDFVIHNASQATATGSIWIVTAPSSTATSGP